MTNNISKIYNINIDLSGANQRPDAKDLLDGDLATHIGVCLEMIPAKHLCRCLRESFMLRLEELQATVPAFKDFVTELTVLLARLDAVEDYKNKEAEDQG